MTTALIIGGGIAGAVTAIALHKAGIGATVYEAYATPADEIGAFLTVGTNGIDALQAVDLDRSVAAAGVPARWLQVFDAAGEQVGQAPITGSERPDLGPRTFKRAALYRVLQDELAARDLPVQRGKRLVDGTATTAGVTATFRRRQQCWGRRAHRRGRCAFGHPAAHRPGRARAALHRPTHCLWIHRQNTGRSAS
ncbi:FAD-dependent oxidoreductase [Fodinicola feengrottensis]|uniref:FAD-dependent oxidoreductase n=1 Tax=Fodinicola feengrottensis TaxID=435914 RepID=UPI0024427AF6|nr:FAD-dependent monooxygenase [Fodinicola feengrottensis]